MLAMLMLVLGIGFSKDVMDLLVDVINPLKKYSFLINLSLIMGRLLL
jgi:hypothetical protein